MLAAAKDLPEYILKVTETNLTSPGGGKAVEVELSIECSTDQSSASASKTKKQKGRGLSMTTVLTVTSDLEFIDFRRIPYVGMALRLLSLLNRSLQDQGPQE